MPTEEQRNICILTNDARLIEAGPGAFGAHAARLAGLPRRVQEEVAQSAVHIAQAVFAKSKKMAVNEFRMQLAIVNLADSVEMSMEGESANTPGASNIFQAAAGGRVNAPDAATLIRWEVRPNACLLFISKTLEARNCALHSETAPR